MNRTLLPFPRLLAAEAPPPATRIGVSREGRPIEALRLGRGAARVSLIAGCHADEPVGPRLLGHLANCLHGLPADDPWVTEFDWWIVPNVNPDGAARNATWQQGRSTHYDIGTYLAEVVREPPGDDIEFGFPRGPDDLSARPENRALFDWWRSVGTPFVLHASLHGMALAGGAWFLLEPAWQSRLDPLIGRLTQRVRDLGYSLHDVERHGEKGFHRMAPGFATRPDSRAMASHFETLGDHETARRFRPSSMEAIRSLGGDPLTLVSELPLFIAPGIGETLGPPDPVAVAWRERLAGWRARLAGGATPEEITREATEAGLRPMKIEDQMAFQWELIVAAIDLVSNSRTQ